MKIFLTKTTKDKMNDIIEYIDHEILYNSNLNGCEYDVIVDSDFTYIEDCEEITGSKLLDKINLILE